jgi:hypothetical protein
MCHCAKSARRWIHCHFAERGRQSITARFWLATKLPCFTVNQTIPRAREPVVHGAFLRRANFLLQNCAIQRNAARISLLWIRSEKQTAQHREKLRKIR